MEGWAPWLSMLLLITAVLYACTVVREDAKRNCKTEETIGFLSHFCLWWHFNWGSLDPPPLTALMIHVPTVSLLDQYYF